MNDIYNKRQGKEEMIMVSAFHQLYETIQQRQKQPQEGSYTAYLFDKGKEKICKKVGEETTEVIIAAMKDDKQELICEISDELYHLFVLMAACDVSIEQVENELAKRSQKQGNLKPERKPIERY